MPFFEKYKSRGMSSTVRAGGETGPLVGTVIEVEIEFHCDTLDDGRNVLPRHAIEEIDEAMLRLFDRRVLISQDDPYADDLVKLKRIKAADPTLFPSGTTGPGIAVFLAQWADEWVHSADWNRAKKNDGNRVSVVAVAVEMNGRVYVYQFD